MTDENEGAFFRIAATKEIAKDVGYFTISWGELDFILLLLIQVLNGMDWTDVEEKFGDDHTRERIDEVNKKFSEYIDCFSDDIVLPKEIMKRFNRLSSARNALAHGVWMQVNAGAKKFSTCNHVGQKNVYISEQKMRSSQLDLNTLIKELAAVWVALNSFEKIVEKPIIVLGFGSPEGVVAAPVGSLFFDLRTMGRKLPTS